jgi:hypothetical protein
MDGFAMLLVGFLAGGVAASAIWAVAVSGRRRAAEAQKLEREQLMSAVGEALAAADAIEAGFRSGATAVGAFRRGLGDRVSAVMRLLRANMHTLDAFFVKYAEREACEYLRLMDNPERRKGEGAVFPAPEAEAAAFAAIPPPQYEPPAAEEAAGDDEGADYYGAPAAPEAEAAEEDFAPAAPEAEAPEEDFAPAAPEVEGAEEDFAPAAAPPETGIVEADFPPAPPETGIIEAPGAAWGEDADFAPPTDRFPALADDAVYAEARPTAPTETYGGVSEEELVLGESPDGAFEMRPTAPPPPQPQSDAWTGGDSIDDFEEAAYAQFEVPVAPAPPHADYQETGKFAIAATGDDHLLTETSSIDKSAILNAMAAAGQHVPAAQTPLPMPTPEYHEPQGPQGQQEHQENQGITGDDVVDSIDNFFKLG